MLKFCRIASLSEKLVQVLKAELFSVFCVEDE
jgi:hypothetical protein